MPSEYSHRARSFDLTPNKTTHRRCSHTSSSADVNQILLLHFSRPPWVMSPLPISISHARHSCRKSLRGLLYALWLFVVQWQCGTITMAGFWLSESHSCRAYTVHERSKWSIMIIHHNERGSRTVSEGPRKSAVGWLRDERSLHSRRWTVK